MTAKVEKAEEIPDDLEPLLSGPGNAPSFLKQISIDKMVSQALAEPIEFTEDRRPEHAKQIRETLEEVAQIRRDLRHGGTLWTPGKRRRLAGKIPDCLFQHEGGGQMTKEECIWFLKRYPQFRLTKNI